MNSRVVGLRVASAIFGIMSLGQIARLGMRIEVNLAGHAVPLWASGVALVVVGFLHVWLGWLSQEPKAAAGSPAAS